MTRMFDAMKKGIPKWKRKNCMRKVKHRTFKAATAAKRNRLGLSPYQCRVCGGWHLGRLMGSHLKLKSGTDEGD